MSEAPSTVTPAFRNRRPGLIGCGIVHLLLGVLLFGFTLTLLATFFAAPVENMPVYPAGVKVYTVLLYLALAVILVVLGMGSMMARRWAPPMILVTSWGWMLGGLVAAGMMGLLLPMITASMPRGPETKAFLDCMSIVLGIVGIVVPLVFILFYRSAHVQATVRQLDPVPRWTDGYPISLLLFASWMFFGAVTVLLSSLMYKTLPIGRFILRGLPVFALMAAMATLLFWIGWGTLRRLPSAWWSAVVLLIIGAAWTVVWIGMTDPKAISEVAGTVADPRQMQMTEALYSSPVFLGWMAFFWIAYLVFLLYIRRYFFARPAQPSAQPH